MFKNNTLSRWKAFFAILTIFLTVVFFALFGYYIFITIPNFSYKVISIFLILIFVSNIVAKIAIDLIEFYYE